MSSFTLAERLHASFAHEGLNAVILVIVAEQICGGRKADRKADYRMLKVRAILSELVFLLNRSTVLSEHVSIWPRDS